MAQSRCCEWRRLDRGPAWGAPRGRRPDVSQIKTEEGRPFGRPSIAKELGSLIARTSPSHVHCALIQFSDPVTLTDTSEKEIRRGFPSAVPGCSVEIRRGPAFLLSSHFAITTLGF